MWQVFALCASRAAVQQGRCNDMAELVSELKNKLMPLLVFKPRAAPLIHGKNIWPE